MTITQLAPRLVVRGAAEAIDFYAAALGAVEDERFTDDAGRIVHAVISIGGFAVAIKDEDETDRAPGALGGTPVILTLSVTDAVPLAEAMVAAGAAVVFPVADHGYGYLDGRLADPFGHLWILSQRL